MSSPGDGRLGRLEDPGSQREQLPLGEHRQTMERQTAMRVESALNQRMETPGGCQELLRGFNNLSNETVPLPSYIEGEVGQFKNFITVNKHLINERAGQTTDALSSQQEKLNANLRRNLESKGRMKRQEIEESRPQTAKELDAFNKKTMEDYDRRYKTEVTLIEVNSKEGYTRWRVKAWVKGFREKEIPYENDLIPERGLLIDGHNYKDRDTKHKVKVKVGRFGKESEAKPLRFSQILYC